MTDPDDQAPDEEVHADPVASLSTLDRVHLLESRVRWSNIRMTLLIIGVLLGGWAFYSFLDGRDARQAYVNQQFHNNACAFLYYIPPTGQAAELLQQMRSRYPDCPAFRGATPSPSTSASPSPSPSTTAPVSSPSVPHSPGVTPSQSPHRPSLSHHRPGRPVRTGSSSSHRPPHSTHPGPSPSESGVLEALCVELRILGIQPVPAVCR